MRLQWATSASKRMTSVDSRLISCCDQMTSLKSISSLWKPRWDPEGVKEEAEEVVVVDAVVATGSKAGLADAAWADCCSFWTSSWSPLCRALRWLISTWGYTHGYQLIATWCHVLHIHTLYRHRWAGATSSVQHKWEMVLCHEAQVAMYDYIDYYYILSLWFSLLLSSSVFACTYIIPIWSYLTINGSYYWEGKHQNAVYTHISLLQ